MKIGDIFTKENYTEYAIWANENNATITDFGGGKYQLVAIPEPLPPTKEEISQLRAIAYLEIDKLHAERDRKTILGTWTSEKETEYIEKVKTMSAEIAEKYPYPEEPVKEEPVQSDLPLMV